MSNQIPRDQIQILIEFMEEHTQFASKYMRTTEARLQSTKLWIELSDKLNSLPHGRKKKLNDWRKYWNHFKTKIKVKLYRKKHNLTPPDLTDMEARALAILRPEFEHLLEKSTDVTIVDDDHEVPVTEYSVAEMPATDTCKEEDTDCQKLAVTENCRETITEKTIEVDIKQEQITDEEEDKDSKDLVTVIKSENADDSPQV